MQQTKIPPLQKKLVLVLLLIVIGNCTPYYYKEKLTLLGSNKEVNKYFQFNGYAITINFDNDSKVTVSKLQTARLAQRLSCISQEEFIKLSNEPNLLSRLPSCKKINYPNNKDLAGIRIAIDPGHSAKNFTEGVFERKFISYISSDQSIQFYESELNMKTALIMKQMLEKKGATVFVTRLSKQFPGKIYFKEWIKGNYRKDLERLIQTGDLNKQKASLFNALDKRGKYLFFQRYIERPWRATEINKFRPHLTFMLHYNATGNHGRDKADKYNEIRKVLNKKDLDNNSKLQLIEAISRRTHMEKDNYSMVFIPGAFMKNELADNKSKLHLLRLLLTNDMDNSKILSKILIQKFIEKINMMPVGSWYGELENNIPTRYKGVYARNLGMTRMVRGPVAFGEPFLQNNKKAIDLITESPVEFAGISAAPILIQTAKAYVEAAEEFIAIKRRANKLN